MIIKPKLTLPNLTKTTVHNVNQTSVFSKHFSFQGALPPVPPLLRRAVWDSNGHKQGKCRMVFIYVKF